MPIKVAMIGAGSIGFTRRLMHDILCVPELADTIFSFTDISARNLEMVTTLCRRDIEANQLPARVESSTDRRAVIGNRARAHVLEALGRLLRSGTRAMDASCRYDENRFAVLLSGVGLATAHSRMEGLRRRCATQIVLLDGQELGFTVAMGVASFPHTAQSMDEVQTACRSALAEARRRGGNHVALASIALGRA